MDNWLNHKLDCMEGKRNFFPKIDFFSQGYSSKVEDLDRYNYKQMFIHIYIKGRPIWMGNRPYIFPGFMNKLSPKNTKKSQKL